MRIFVCECPGECLRQFLLDTAEYDKLVEEDPRPMLVEKDCPWAEGYRSVGDQRFEVEKREGYSVWRPRRVAA